MDNFTGDTVRDCWGGDGRPAAKVAVWLSLFFLAGLLLSPESWAAGAGRGGNATGHVEAPGGEYRGVLVAGSGAADKRVVGQVEPVADDDDYDPWGDDPWGDDPWNGDTQTLADPLEPLNRLFFVFNDRLYRHALNPVATGYAKTVPEDIRLCVRSFFRNLLAPVRIVNNLLQGQFRDSGTELARFAINTTIGIGGLVDSAARNFGIESRYADLGQTLGIYGIGDGFYIHWPLLGPSTLRDSVGMAGDGLINPITRVMFEDTATGVGMHAARTVNATSLRLGEYERLKEAAFDPYLAIRDAYWQYRRNLVRSHRREQAVPAFFGEGDSGTYRKSGQQDRKKSLPAVDAETQPPAEPESAPIAATLAVPVMAELWPAVEPCGSERYFLHVGAYLDYQHALREQQRLGEWAAGACLLEHDRGDYRFYGLLIPVGNDFAAAKEVELQLAAVGREGWLVTALNN